MKNRFLLPALFVLFTAALIYAGIRMNKAYPEPSAPGLSIVDGENGPVIAVGAEGASLSLENLDVLRRPSRVYASYHIITNYGVQKKTGATWLETDAWQKVTNDPQADGARFISDLIAKLNTDGELDDISLSKRGNYLVVLWPGAPPRTGWVMDSRRIPQASEASE